MRCFDAAFFSQLPQNNLWNHKCKDWRGVRITRPSSNFSNELACEVQVRPLRLSQSPTEPGVVSLLANEPGENDPLIDNPSFVGVVDAGFLEIVSTSTWSLFEP
jgi:hypothetical protein|mmetsp:Transcript_81872/g.128952  ORF Transcript_81872/g.128952 Transcript_81872/m.128952 type:complete len:104 (-) Transcript_81872:436-747(-)